jgi:hypothetical protein
MALGTPFVLLSPSSSDAGKKGYGSLMFKSSEAEVVGGDVLPSDKPDEELALLMLAMWLIPEI